MGIKDALSKAVAGDPDKTGNLPATAAKGDVALAETAFDGLPTGYENVSAKDLIIPRLVVLQGLSPQLNKNKPEYIKEAQSGDFCDVATGEIWKEGLDLIPCYYATVYLEWAPRDSGKGLVANHGTDADKAHKNAQMNEKRQWITKEGNLIAETATYFCLNMSAGARRSFIPFSSTGLKDARQWMTLITNEKLTRSDGSTVPAPLFYRSWTATTVGKSNAQGDWNGWKFKPNKTILEIGGKALLDEAVDFHREAKDGLVQGSFEPEPQEDNDKM